MEINNIGSGEIRYQPKALYYADSDALEYVRVDEPVIYRRIDNFLTLILSMDSRETVGFKIKGFRNFYLRQIRPSLTDDNVRFLRLVTILERIITNFGDSFFIEAQRREAYKTAADIAMKDQVLVSDLPEAA